MKDFLDKDSIFKLKLVIGIAEDMIIEMGFTPSEISIENITDGSKLEWTEGVAVKTVAAGTRTAEAGAISIYAGATKVKYNDALVPSYENADGGAAIDKDLYIQLSRTAQTTVDIPNSTITTTFTEGVKTLGQRLPQLLGNSDNGNSYVTRPGFMIDVSATAVVADGKTIIITAKR